MRRLFICYRRDDTGDYAANIANRLQSKLPKDHVFIDLDGIRVGTQWAATLDEALSRAQLLLVIIGEQWLTLEREGRPRLVYEDDWVRREIRTAIGRGIHILPVLPKIELLPGQASLPEDIAKLADWQGIEVRPSGVSFRTDSDRLVEEIRRILPDPKPRRWLVAVAAAVLLALLGARRAFSGSGSGVGGDGNGGGSGAPELAASTSGGVAGQAPLPIGTPSGGFGGGGGTEAGPAVPPQTGGTAPAVKPTAKPPPTIASPKPTVSAEPDCRPVPSLNGVVATLSCMCKGKREGPITLAIPVNTSLDVVTQVKNQYPKWTCPPPGYNP